MGLHRGPRRRAPGLRRQELAQLTGMSADYLMRIEQGRATQPSVQMLTAMARALRLSEDERDHLFLIAGHQPPAGRYDGSHVRPGLLYLLDQLSQPETTDELCVIVFGIGVGLAGFWAARCGRSRLSGLS